MILNPCSGLLMKIIGQPIHNWRLHMVLYIHLSPKSDISQKYFYILILLKVIVLVWLETTSSIAQISRLSYAFFCYVFFCYQAPTILGGHSGQFSLQFYQQDSVWIRHLKSLEIGGSGGAIYLPYLVLHHTAWSAQIRGCQFFRDQVPSLSF